MSMITIPHVHWSDGWATPICNLENNVELNDVDIKSRGKKGKHGEDSICKDLGNFIQPRAGLRI